MKMAIIAIEDEFEPPPKVVSADRMEDEHFVLHFNNRHSDQLAGLNGILLDKDERTIDLYREFHDKIHQWHLPSQMEAPHEHGN